ncbi:hypothetical protein C5K23_21135 [Shigella boydii]|nr:hypothetical protein C5K23_21135 [Shigella boydii]
MRPAALKPVWQVVALTAGTQPPSPIFFDRCVGNKKIGTPEGAPAIFRLPMVKFSPFARLKGGCYLEISQLAVRSL